MTAATGAARQRLKQSLLLAHRLTEKQAEIGRLTGELTQARALVEKQAAELSAIHAAAARAGRRDSLLQLFSADATTGAGAGVSAAAAAGVDGAIFPPGAHMAFAGTSAFPMLTGSGSSSSASGGGRSGSGGMFGLDPSLAAQQPYAFLVESLRAQGEELRGRESVVETLRTRVAVLDAQLDAERSKARELSARFGADIRRIAAQQRQVQVLRGVVTNLLRQYGDVMSSADIESVATTVKKLGRDTAAAGDSSSGDGDAERDDGADENDAPATRAAPEPRKASGSRKVASASASAFSDPTAKAAELIRRALQKSAKKRS
jgi:hypothetical protein